MFTVILFILQCAIGFIMGFLYKRATTNSQFFSPDPKFWLRIFTAVFAIAVLVTYGLSWYATFALHGSNIPDENTMNYTNIKSVMVFVLNLSFFLLLVLSNFYSQSLKKLAIVPYLLAFGFYFIFVLKDAYYTSDNFALWQRSLQLIKGNMPDFTSTAWLKTLLSFIVTAFNAAIIWWGLRK